MSILGLNTQISTPLRGVVRSLCKNHVAWRAFCAEKGMISSDAKNVQLLEFALRHPDLAAKVAKALGVQAPSALEGVKVDLGPGPVIGGEEDLARLEAQADAIVTTAEQAFTLDQVLSSVDQFLAPRVRGELAEALKPLVAAANKPAQVVPVEVVREVEVERVVERIVEVAPGEKPKRPVNVARRGKKIAIRTLFPSKAKDAWNDAQVTQWEGAASPAVDPFYVVNRYQMAQVMTAFERAANVWLTGPASSGKSTLPEQAAAHLGRPFVKFGMNKQVLIEDLIGGTALVDGKTVWQDGALVQAIRTPGMVILIDELTAAPPGVQMIFHSLCDDHRSITLPTGEVVRVADGVAFVVADNTAGSGDETGLYAGTHVSNAALVTRFKRMILMDYLTPAQEADALVNHTACPMPAAKKLAEFAAQVRKMPSMQGVVLSLRQMVGFVQDVQDGFSAMEAFHVAIASRLPSVEKAAMEALATLQWNSEFEDLMRGGTAKAPAPQPSDSKAAKAFADEQF